MKVLSVEPMKFNNYGNTNFCQRKKNKETVKNQNASGLAQATPVIVLMALNPSLLNAKLPENLTDNNIKSVTVTDSHQPESDALTYVIPPEINQRPQQTSAPYGWQTFNFNKVRQDKIVKINGKNYHFLLTNIPGNKNNEIHDIFFVPVTDAGKSNPESSTPPHVGALYIYNAGKENEFCTVKYHEDIVENGKEIGSRGGEFRIDEQTAQEIYDLLYGDPQYTPWVNKTTVGKVFKEPGEVPKPDKVVYRNSH